MYRFAAASANEPIVFGAARPKYNQTDVSKWIEYMKSHGIRRVCCLLTKTQLARYTDLLENYQQAFGMPHVCWAPIEDFSLATLETLTHQILPFLADSDRQNQKVVVHCSGGIGRTGQVLGAWLVARRALSVDAAIAAVKKTGRNPYEAVLTAPIQGRNPWQVAVELNKLLEDVSL